MSVINALENTTSHLPLHFVTKPQFHFLTVIYTGFITFGPWCDSGGCPLQGQQLGFAEPC